jgi:hypothetical protein
MKCLVILVIALVGLPGAMSAEAAEMITIGAVEDIVLMPWGVKLSARIDTGAALSSIDACDIKIEGGYVSFALADRCGGHKMRKKLLNIKEVRTSEGKEQRPVVMMEFCIASSRIKTRVTLNDRTSMDYPVLIGRNTMRKRFMVDVSRKHLATPTCVNLNPGLGSDLLPAGAADKKTGASKP